MGGWSSPPGRKEGGSLGGTCVHQTQGLGLWVGQVWAGPCVGSPKNSIKGSSQGFKSQSDGV